MNKEQYRLGWQFACWSTLSIAVCTVLSVVSGIFGIISSLAVAGIGYGLMTAANELAKESNPAATSLKSASITAFILAGLQIISAIIIYSSGITALKNMSFSDLMGSIIFAGLLVIVFGILFLIFKKQFASALAGLDITPGLTSPGILVFGIGQIFVGLGIFIFGASPSLGTLNTMGSFIFIGGLASIVGMILWIIGMFNVTNRITK